MTKHSNKRRGELALPGHPGGRCIRFTFDVKERLQSAYSTEDNMDWVSKIYDGVNLPDMEMIKNVIDTAKVGDEPIDFAFLDEATDAELAEVICDALCLSLNGRTIKEHLEYIEKQREEDFEKKVPAIKAEMEKNNLPEAEVDLMISLARLNAMGIALGSGQQNSGNSPISS